MAHQRHRFRPLGESITQATLLRWHQERWRLRRATDEPLAELETDKANVDLPAPSAGVLQPRAKVGRDRCKVGDVIAHDR